jgi:hypothetical protein
MEAWLGELKPSAAEPRGSAGWRLAKSGWRLIRGSRTALTLALLLAALWTVAGWIAVEGDLDFTAGHASAGGALLNAAAMVVVVFLLGALAATVDAAVDGFDLDLRDAFEETRMCARDLFWWAALNLAFWFMLAVLLGHAKGLLVLVNLGWFVTTAFAVPMIVIGGLPPLSALGESGSLIRRRWRESLNALVGIAFFTGLACFPAGAVLTHAHALARETGNAQRPLAILGLLLLFAAIALGVATKEAFSAILTRDDFGDLSPREYTGPTLDRGAKARRVLIGIVVTIAVVGTFTAITQHDRKVVRASSSPGANYVALASDPSGAALPSGSPVVYQGREIGQVLGSSQASGGLRVSIHVEPGYTPSSAPGYFVVDATGEEPRLLLISTGEAPPVEPPV